MLLVQLIALFICHASLSGASSKATSSVRCGNTVLGLSHAEEYICVIEKDENLVNAFGAVRISVNCSKDCEVFTGKSMEEVINADSTLRLVFSGLYSMFFAATSTSHSSDSTILSLSPFEQTFVRVRPYRGVKFVMRVQNLVLHVPCVVFLILGMVLFFSAQKLSHSISFYYTGGVGIGVVASALIIVFIIGRLVPKKPAAYTFMLGGWSFCAFIMRRLWHNWQELLVEYRMYVLVYVGAAGFLSFAICYWKGPVTDPRSQKVIQWTIQLFGLISMYHSSPVKTVSLAIITAAALASFFSSTPDIAFRRPWDFLERFWNGEPEPRRFLTEEEYRREAEIETKKALEELKRFCDSPQCSPWKTMSRIKSPVRFVRFMEGESHVSDAEMTLHDEEALEEETEEDADLISDDDTEDSEPSASNGVTKMNGKYDPNISEDSTT